MKRAGAVPTGWLTGVTFQPGSTSSAIRRPSEPGEKSTGETTTSQLFPGSNIGVFGSFAACRSALVTARLSIGAWSLKR